MNWSSKPVKLSVSIMAHPARDGYVMRLLRRMGEIPVSWDPHPVSTDTEQRWANGRRAWEMHDPTADWHLVLQDDVLVANNLIPALANALRFVPPETTMSPYFGERPLPQRDRKDVMRLVHKHYASWITRKRMIWGVAMCVPVATIPDMVAWCTQKKGQPYDYRVGSYYKNVLRWPCWYLYPSLVDHRHRGTSLLGHGPDRKAELFHGGDAWEVDVEGPVIDMEAGNRVRTLEQVWRPLIAA